MTLPCKRCSAPVEVLLPVGSFGVMCEACAVVDAALESKAAREASRAAQWALLCPPRFTDTCMEKLPQPDKTRRAMRWIPGADGFGLNLWGHPDTGKTRTLFLVLQSYHHIGKSVRVFTVGQFERELERRAFKRGPFIEACCRVDVLAFDDFDKMNLTKEMERTFFALMDRRMADRNPVLLTHNSTAAELTYTFRWTGEPLVRRIRDFCESIHFPRA